MVCEYRKRLLTDSAGRGRKGIVRVTADQADCPDNQNQNYRQHDRVFGDILSFFVGPEFPAELKHAPLPIVA